MKKTLLLFLALISTSFIYSQNLTKTIKFLKGNIADKTAAVREASGAEAVFLANQAINFCIESKEILGNDRELEGLAVAAILSISPEYAKNCPENEKLILDIDSGILREVSVGCAVKSVKCSVCGEDIAVCTHKKGETYSGKLCCGELIAPYDAYEFSFVAVPAQKEAGVVKSVYGKEVNMEGIMKKLGENRTVTLSGGECEKLMGYIETLKQSAKDGVYYRDSLTSEVLRLSAAVQPEISRDTMEALAKTMNVAQLCEFKNAYEKKLDESFAPVPQLYAKSKKTVSNGQFTI